MNTKVTPALANLLKEKEFKFKQLETYHNPLSGFTKYEEITPIIADVVMWLYEKHQIHITYTSDYNWNLVEYRDKAKFYYVINFDFLNSLDENLEPKVVFDTPTEAYLAGIEYILKQLI
jgi:hypothetical protein